MTVIYTLDTFASPGFPVTRRATLTRVRGGVVREWYGKREFFPARFPRLCQYRLGRWLRLREGYTRFR